MSAESSLKPPKPAPEKADPSFQAPYIPGRAVWITWGIALSIVTLGRVFAHDLDMAVVNGVTAGGVFACWLSMFIWIVWYSGFTPLTRRLVFLANIGLVVFLVTCVRYRFDGSLVPHPRFVWNRLPDQRLEAPVTMTSANSSDERPQLVNEVGFPQFLGPNRDAVLTGPKLITDWNAHPPKLKWRRPIGAGWSGFSGPLRAEAVTLEQRGDDEWVVCYLVETGDPVWSHAVHGRHTEAMGGVGPRSTPTIDDGRVYTLGANGNLHCFDLFTGEILWQKQLLDVIGVQEGTDQQAILWGRASSPLVYQDLLIVPGGGPADGKKCSLVAFDKLTGEVRWKGGDSQAGYSSPTIAKLHGIEQILIVNEASVAGHHPADGRELWKFDWFGESTGRASVAQPHVVSDSEVFISKAYGGGMKLLQVDFDEKSGQWSVQQEKESMTVMKTKFTNAAILGDYAYALSDSILECVDWHTAKAKWKRGRYGQGQLLAVGDVLLIQCESGEVALVAARPDKYQELTRFQAIHGITWNNPCLYNNLLLVRNAEEAACYELPVE